MHRLPHKKANFLRGGAAFIGGFIGRFAFWKTSRRRRAETLLLNSLLTSERKWESEGLTESDTFTPRKQKKELAPHVRR